MKAATTLSHLSSRVGSSKPLHQHRPGRMKYLAFTWIDPIRWCSSVVAEPLASMSSSYCIISQIPEGKCRRLEWVANGKRDHHRASSTLSMVRLDARQVTRFCSSQASSSVTGWRTALPILTKLGPMRIERQFLNVPAEISPR